MTTILVLNAVSSLLAAIGLGGFRVLKDRRARGRTLLQPIYVTARRTPPPPGR